MKFLCVRVVEWVVWRWTLPARYREARREYWSSRALNDQLQVRCEKAERAPSWKSDYEHELARGKEARRALDEALAELQALKNGETATGLSPAEVERLALLAMAAGKLAGEAAKVIMYGWGSPSPQTGRPAYMDVEHGMGRLAAAVELMVGAGDVRAGDIHAHTSRAKLRMGEQATRQ